MNNTFRKWEADMVRKDLSWGQFGAVGMMVLGGLMVALSIFPLHVFDASGSSHLPALVFGMFWLNFGHMQFQWVRDQKRFNRLEKQIHELQEHSGTRPK